MKMSWLLFAYFTTSSWLSKLSQQTISKHNKFVLLVLLKLILVWNVSCTKNSVCRASETPLMKSFKILFRIGADAFKYCYSVAMLEPTNLARDWFSSVHLRNCRIVSSFCCVCLILGIANEAPQLVTLLSFTLFLWFGKWIILDSTILEYYNF